MTLTLAELQKGRTVVVERFIPLLNDNIMIRLPTRDRIREIYPPDGQEFTTDQQALLFAEALTDDIGERLTQEEAVQMIQQLEGNNAQAVTAQIYEAITDALQGEGAAQGKP